MITSKDVQSPRIRFDKRPAAGAFAAPPPPAIGPSKRRVAILAVHGMGQQIPFQTMDAITEGFVAEDARRGNAPRVAGPVPVDVRNVLLGGQLLQRVELELHGRQGPVEVHVYEAYWAPFTEGEVGIRDVFAFLFRAAFSGIRNSVSPFYRWMFGGYQNFGRHLGSVASLLWASCLLGTLALLNLLMMKILASKVGFGDPAGWPTGALLTGSTWLAGLLAVYLLLFGASIGLAFWAKKKGGGAWNRSLAPVRGALPALGVLGLLLVVFVAAALVVLFVRDRSHPPAIGAGGGFSSNDFLLVWGLLLLASVFVRRFFVQYVGDVAGYVSPEYLDRFSELRKKIKEFVLGIGRGIYAQTNPGGGWSYDEVAIVGHSLGSVIAYDLLNRLILEDGLKAPALGVLSRTNVFMTFGSPLNKTAFLFGDKGTHTSVTREHLAALVQPLIDSFANRAFPWINVYSPLDVVSGKLTLYDTIPRPRKSPPRVRDVRDRDANTLLAAHLEYWQNPTIFRFLHRVIAP